MATGEQFTLECEHCGDVAYTSDVFHDGDGGACESCGFPGRVSLDEDGTIWWHMSESAMATCSLPNCDECASVRK